MWPGGIPIICNKRIYLAFGQMGVGVNCMWPGGIPIVCNKGIYLAPSQFEVAFISSAQSDSDLEKAIKMTEWSFKIMLEK